MFKEEKYEEARQKFQEAMNLSGYQCDLAYNIAL
jgi:tetratricopeptide repeat protein 30